MRCIKTCIYNSDNYALKTPAVVDPITGETLREEEVYYPRVDVTVTVGQGFQKTPGATVEVLDKLAAIQVTPDNWQLLAAELDYLDIPQKQDIVKSWREKFEPVIPPEVTQALENDPQLLALVEQAVQGSAQQETQEMPQETQGPAMETAEAPIAATYDMDGNETIVATSGMNPGAAW